jgi:plastocyanin
LSLLSVLFILALVLNACQTATPTPDLPATAEPTAEPADTEEPTNTQPPEPTEEEMMEVKASVMVRDQQVIDGTVLVPEAVIATPGWLVIHADQNGSPGPVLGYTPLQEGTNQEVVIELDMGEVTSTLYAMLHQDTGEAGVYEFPDADPPVTADDSVVVKPFQVEMEDSASLEMMVEVVDSAFVPEEITIEPGTTVVWEQTGSLPHTVTADDGSFDSGDMSAGDTFTYTFEEEGTYPYYCVYHGGPGGQGMAGVIIVGDGGEGMSDSDAGGTDAADDETDSLY